MSRENLEVIRQAFDSFNRRDLARAVAVFERNAEWVPYLAALEEEVYRGPDEIERMWIEVLRVVPDFRIEFVQVVADSPDTVVVEVEFLGGGKASGADIRTTLYQAASFRDGKVTRVQGFRTAAEAWKPWRLSGVWNESAWHRRRIRDGDRGRERLELR